MLEGTVMTIGIDNLFDETFSIHPTVIRQPGRSVRLTLSRQF
jgi:hemoglobin/transferrin/lactoferrin receptor protein